MRRMRLAATLFALTLSSTALGVPIITVEDGSTLVVDSATKANYDVRGSLDIRAGADVNSVYSYSEGSGKVTMSGGRVDYGISLSRGLFESTGGESYGAGNYSNGLDIGWGQAVISGGTFVGGNGTLAAGSGVAGSAGTWNGVPFVSELAISGGTFIGGTGAGGYYGGDTGYSLISLGNTTVTGGEFLSPIAINAAYGGVTSFFGTGLSYDAATQTLSGVLSNGDALHALVYLSGGTVAETNDDGTEITFSYDSGVSTDPPTNPEPPPVPEPTSLIVFGLAGAFAMARHRRISRGRTASRSNC
ncbi:PEP-CTERM sorting domain-containing protein [Paludisphaera rhizosphaerae]|uniref:PEP-CTERM sorting domain-containing protein n=1 Tax=Paludisphaera rhizosphaerae TaxID=2711216 RepID=UPI0013EAEEF9|nr:PEP-CTERM sorting domain-containing protein [Paludisphaera rhizosphaerae]